MQRKAETPVTKSSTFKTVLIGNTKTGKSSFLLQYIDGYFNEELAQTIGVDFKVKIIDHNKQKIRNTIWDTAGQERFLTLTTSYYRDADAVMLFVDPTKPLKDQVKQWADEIKQYAPNTPVLVVMSKSDLAEEHQFEQVALEAELNQHGLHPHSIHQISSKIKDNIYKVEETLERLVINKFQSCQPSVLSQSMFQPKSSQPVNSIGQRITQTLDNNPYKTAIATGASLGAALGVVLFATGSMPALGIAVLGALGAAAFALMILLAKKLAPLVKESHITHGSPDDTKSIVGLY